MKKTIMFVLLSTLMFSSMEIALKTAGGAFSPIQLNLLRFFVGGLVLLPFVLKNRNRQHANLNWRAVLIFMLTGFLCVIVSMTLYQLAIVYDEAATVAVLFSCNPVFAIILAYLLLKERVGRLNLISMGLSLLGLLVIVNPVNLTNPIGISLSVGSAVTFGLYSIVSRWGSSVIGLDGLSMTCYTFLAGSLELLALVLISKVPAVSRGLSANGWTKLFANVPIFQNVTPHYFLLLFFIAVCVTGGGFAFYFLAMDRGGVSMASLVFFIKPGLAPILALLILHEQLTLNTIGGILIILISSVITFIGNRNKESASKMANSNE